MSDLKDKFTVFFMIFLGFGLQTQITILKNTDYTGLRINSVDFSLPIIGLVIVISLLLKKSSWPKYRIKYLYGWLSFLGFALLAALLNTYFLYGEVIKWATFNKFIGWGVLCAYFLMGAWITTNLKRAYVYNFFISLFVVLIFVLFLQSVGQSIFLLSDIKAPLIYMKYPIEGLMGNKNSFTFLLLTCLCFSTLFFSKNCFFKYTNYAFWFLLAFAFVYTGARAALLVFPFILACLIYTNRAPPWKKILFVGITGILFVSILQYASPKKSLSLKPTTLESAKHIDGVFSDKNIEEIRSEIKHKGDHNRLYILNHVINMIKEKPVLGSGLGSVLMTQDKDAGHIKDIMDCTVLWLWAETGIFGLLFFMSFYLVCFFALFKSYKNTDNSDFERKISGASMIMLFTFGFMSLFHELLYTRFLWFFLGLSLAIPLNQATSQSKEI